MVPLRAKHGFDIDAAACLRVCSLVAMRTRAARLLFIGRASWIAARSTQLVLGSLLLDKMRHYGNRLACCVVAKGWRHNVAAVDAALHWTDWA
jgi:hypothetical protein